MTSSLHGDEVDEVRVIDRLFLTELDPESLHGTVGARISGTRGMDGIRLNLCRCVLTFVPVLMIQKKYGSVPQHYAFNLLYRRIEKFQWLIDLRKVVFFLCSRKHTQ